MKNNQLKIRSIALLTFVFGCTFQKEINVPVEKNSYADIKEISERQDYLIAVTKDSIFRAVSSTAFVDIVGDTIIPFGKYSHCWTDTLKNYAIVFDKKNTNSRVVGINRKEEILFDIYFFDNWPDEENEGLFRVLRNGKIGYANENGEIVISCQFECAHFFKEGKAKVTFNCTNELDEMEHVTPRSDTWFFIDKKGERVK